MPTPDCVKVGQNPWQVSRHHTGFDATGSPQKCRRFGQSPNQTLTSTHRQVQHSYKPRRSFRGLTSLAVPLGSETSDTPAPGPHSSRPLRSSRDQARPEPPQLWPTHMKGRPRRPDEPENGPASETKLETEPPIGDGRMQGEL